MLVIQSNLRHRAKLAALGPGGQDDQDDQHDKDGQADQDDDATNLPDIVRKIKNEPGISIQLFQGEHVLDHDDLSMTEKIFRNV